MSYIKQKKHNAISSHLVSGVGLGVVLLSGALSPMVLAATADKNSLEEVIVEGTHVNDKNEMTSFKFTQPIAKTPQTIQVIDKGLIKDQHATTLSEALKNTAGVGTFYAGENGNTTTGDAIYMRGFDASGSIFVDGVRDLGAVSRDTFNTEQIEVIKGANGANYGRSAPGGSINMVSKRAHLEDHSELDISLGSEKERRAAVDVNKKLSDTIAFRLNVMGEDSPKPGRDVAENKRWGIAPAFSFGLGTATRTFLNFLHVTQNNIPDGNVPTIGLPGYDVSTANSDQPNVGLVQNAPKVNSKNFYGTDNDFEDVTINRAMLRVEQDFSTGTFHNATSVSHIDQNYQLSAFMFAVSKLGGVTNDGTLDSSSTNINDWTMRRMANFMDRKNKLITNQSGITQELVTGDVTQSLSYGLELIHEEVYDRKLSSPLDSTTGMPMSYSVNLYHPLHSDASYYGVKTGAYSKGTVNTAALYFFDTLTIAEDWKVTAGLRLDHYKAQTEGVATNCAGRGQPACAGGVYTLDPKIKQKDDGNLLTWQLGLMYQITEQGNIYADYAVAAQPPGGNNLTFSSSASSADNPNFDPTKTKTAEMGTKWNLADERLLLSAAIYRTVIGDQVEQDPVDSQYYQTGRKQVQGLELSAVGKITQTWDLSLSYSKMSAKVSRGKNLAQDGSTDLSYTPSDSFTAWTSYSFPFGLKIGGGVRYVGELKRGTDGAIGTPTKVESYWVGDAMAAYSVNEQFDLQLNIYNLTNEDYVASINKSGYRYTPAIPRSAMLSAKFKF